MTRPPDLSRPGPAAAILLPLPLADAYDYRLPAGKPMPRGTLVTADVRGRAKLGVIWGAPQGGVEAERLKTATPLEGQPALPEKLCDFIAWMAAYTLNPPGAILAMALRSPDAFAPETGRTAYRAGGHMPIRLSDARRHVLQIAQDGAARSIAVLCREAGVSPALVRGLIKAGALIPTSLPEFAPFPTPDPDFATPRLDPDQQQAVDALAEAQGFTPFLLDGVTGSGKTEVYFEALALALKQGKQVLILLPEIALTVQFLERFAARFGVAPAEWHSDLPARERRRTYRAVRAGEAKVVVGARSALFLPFADLGLIVVDEEHETAFKQQDGVLYHARDMGVVRARIENCPIILASATPSLESFVNAQAGRYRHLVLSARHGPAQLPKVELIDMRRTHKGDDAGGQWLSARLCKALEETLAAGEQGMLFLNRRGYAPLTLCQACGHKFICPNCSTWLVEHRSRRRLSCHQCGHEMPMPRVCPVCHEDGTLIPCGPGVERVAEEFAQTFPDARFAIASSDTLDGPRAMQQAIRAMEDHTIDVLIGTQIVAKGHHFPELTLVGVVDADLGGSDGDVRARERTFQLLHQVAGRAGRAQKPGLVLLQTRNPGDAVMQALAGADRNGFYTQERQFRLAASAPPFGRLAAIIVSGRDAEKVRGVARALGKAAPKAQGVKVWGPTPAFYALLRGQTRERLLVQAAKTIDMQAFLKTWLALVKPPSTVRIAVDIDPVSFF